VFSAAVRRWLTIVAAASLASGCVGVFSADGTSVSLGSHVGGALLGGVPLPVDGTGYTVPSAWRGRDRQYTTEEVARWLAGAFRAVSRAFPDSVAPLGDLSPRGGGWSAQHQSHRSGRDVDIFLYAVDREGRPFRAREAMLRFGADGEASGWSPAVRGQRIRAPVPPVRFDARRTWALVRAMITDPAVHVQWIFINRALGELVLREATAGSDSPAVVARAAALLHQPTDSLAHDDHMHVRVFCAPADRPLGCQDRGPQRWWKKHWKYMGAPLAVDEAAPAVLPAAVAAGAP
jgi:penicillin-insensitive murein endopeptidase